MTHPLDITGTRTVALVLPLSADAVASLTDAGVPVPEPAQVRLFLVEATMRERARFQADQEAGGPATLDPMGWLAGLLLRRAEPDTDLRVLVEVVADMGPTDIAMLTHAYVMGVLPDPKVTAQAVQMTLTGMTNGLLGALASAAPSPSSPTSTG